MLFLNLLASLLFQPSFLSSDSAVPFSADTSSPSSFLLLMEPLVSVFLALENLSNNPDPSSSSKSPSDLPPSTARLLVDAFFFLIISSLSPKGFPSPASVLNL